MLVLRRNQYLVARPPNGPVFQAATYLHRSPGWSYAREFSRWNRKVEAQLQNTPGALAYSLQRPLIGREAWTLSLWSDRSSMLAFVQAGAHHSAAGWLRTTEEIVGKFAQWEAAQPSLRWEDAYDRLGVSRPKGKVLAARNPIPTGWGSVPR